MTKPDNVSDRVWAEFLKLTSESQMEWVLCTPEQAQQWLYLNDKNRKLSSPTVTYYADQIKSGDWFANGQTIIFLARANS